MARLPFNSDLAKGDEVPECEPDTSSATNSKNTDHPLTVTELASKIRSAINTHLPVKIRVAGEISNLSNRTHWFFSLKDENAAIRSVCFASNAKRIRFPVKDGMQVVATGRIDFFDAQGSIQLYVDKLEPVGVGDLELRFRALCDELRELGYFNIDHKKQLPAMPSRIAIVTSRAAAALQDVIDTAHRRWPACELLLADVRVQGEQASREIAKAIARLSKSAKQLILDAIIITRGGGSIEDLWAFNERVVADAIFKCPIPIVAAIGHETDTTVAELVADERCATPTQAVMRLVPDAAALMDQVTQFSHRLHSITTRHLDYAKQRLTAAAKRPLFQKPDQLYAPLREKLDRMTSDLQIATRQHHQQAAQQLTLCETQLNATLPHRLERATQQLKSATDRLAPTTNHQLAAHQQRLTALTKQLESVSPNRVLGRGYSVTLDASGQPISKAKQAATGDSITTILADGRIKSTIDSTAASKLSSTSKVKTKKTVRKKKRVKDDDQTKLF